MSNNKEKREYLDKVHLFLALQRPSKQGPGQKACIRHVIKEDEEKELAIFEAKLKVIGGEWRIHRTVNARDTKKAYNWFMKYLIDYPERVSALESIWRTALLQKECKVTKYFMLDIDTKDYNAIFTIEKLIKQAFINSVHEFNGSLDNTNPFIIQKIKSPNGWHYITVPFDTREVEKLEYCTLIRDGYFYVKTVN